MARREAGLTKLVIDSCDTGKRLRRTNIAGQPVVYSLGGIGHDDKGLIDCGYDPNKPADWTFRLESWKDHNRRFEAVSRR